MAKKVNMPIKYSDFADVFLKKSAKVPPKRTRVHEHAIKLEEGKQPPYGPIYSLRPVELETFKTYIETNLANGFIRASKSPAGALILFVRKPDGSIRLYGNYQGLNNLTIKNWYPLLLIGKFLNWLGQAKQFIQINLMSSYHRIRLKEGDEWKTAFRTWYAHFKYQVMPFGLCNPPASFNGYINKILAEKLNIFVIVYLDNIFINIEDQGQAYANAVWWVLEELRKNGLFANLKKCRFYKVKVRFLRYVILAQGIRMEETKRDAMKNWPEPKSIHDIQVFLGFANFYRCFI